MKISSNQDFNMAQSEMNCKLGIVLIPIMNN